MKLGQGVAAVVIIAAAVGVAALLLADLKRSKEEPPTPDQPKLYHDPRRGVTCYVFAAGVSCVADVDLMTVR